MSRDRNDLTFRRTRTRRLPPLLAPPPDQDVGLRVTLGGANTTKTVPVAPTSEPGLRLTLRAEFDGASDGDSTVPSANPAGDGDD